MRRPHLAFLDGIRGLASIYVVFFHLAMAQVYSKHLPGYLYWPTCWLRYGQFAVDVFIVLSGYCLMIPVARAADGRLPGGLLAFIVRRARRIFPPYYGALCIAIGILLLAHVARVQPNGANPEPLSAANIGLHLLMLHAWSPQYAPTIDLPMWTVSVEWHIYFVFALLLLPIWQRAGIVSVLIVAFLIGEGPRWILPISYNLDWARPWYVGLFALGMAAALVHHRPDAQPASAWTARWRWGWITAALWIGVVSVELVGGEAHALSALWAKDVLVGCATASFLAWCVSLVEAGRGDALVIRLLQSRPAIALGSFSYSLYLIHVPSMWIVKQLIQKLRMPDNVEYLFRLTVAPFLILPAAYVFYRIFERPFLARKIQNRYQTELGSADIVEAPAERLAPT